MTGGINSISATNTWMAEDFVLDTAATVEALTFNGWSLAAENA